MSIDQLHITFNTLGDENVSQNVGNNGPYRDDEVAPDPRHIDYHDITDALMGSGFRCREGRPWRSNGAENFKLGIFGVDGRPNAMQIMGRSYNRHYVRLKSMTCNPSRFGTRPNFRRLLNVINANSSADIFRTGQITRIDYACDYRMEFPVFIQGLYYDFAQTVLAYTDVEDPFEEYEWQRGLHSSFRIGKGKKVFKIYDKARRERQQVNYFLSRQTSDTEGIEGDFRDDETDDAETENLDRASIDERLARIPPRSRIELSLTQRNVIARLWRQPGRNYSATLGELEDHLEDIAAGRFRPFEGMLMNHVQFRTSDRLGFRFIDNHQNLRRRFQVEDGFLNPLYRAMRGGGVDFWQACQNSFALFPWRLPYQPTTVFRRRMTQWARGDAAYDPLGMTMPPAPEYYTPTRITQAPWPLQLTRTRQSLGRNRIFQPDSRNDSAARA